MTRQIEDELLKFETNISELRKNMDVEKVCPFAYIITPKKKKIALKGPKTVAFTVSGIVHGNETVGLAILNEFLHLLITETLDCRIPLGIFLGNVPAARENIRFLERDLNRCFNRDGETGEEKRARELTPLLKQTQYYFDIHQTNRPAEEPFFIFPFAKEPFLFAQNISAYTTIVTHVNSSFSEDGLCTDEFVNKNGGIGLTLECGKAGFDTLQVGFGLKTLMHCVRYIQNTLENKPTMHHDPNPNRKIFVVKDTIPCPQKGKVKLAENLSNLQVVKKGDHLATIDGKKILSPRNGRIVFPNYAAEVREPGSRPAELMRILEAIKAQDLPVT